MYEWDENSISNPSKQERALEKEYEQASKNGKLKGVRPPGDPYSPLYFRSLFPVDSILQILQCNANDNELVYREFSFTFENHEGHTYWTRYKTFKTTQQLRKYIEQKEPLRIDIGSSGYEPPIVWRQHKTDRILFGDFEQTKWCESELVIDVDLKDYADVRTCNCTSKRIYDPYCPECGLLVGDDSHHAYEKVCNCSWKKFKDNICASCWKFAQCAMMILDYILRHKWGFKDFFFVFSGGKGIHCWILDEHARSFDHKQRDEFVQSFLIWKPNGKKISRDRMLMENLPYDPIFGQDFDNFLTFLFKQLILSSNIFDIRHEQTRARIVDYFDLQGMSSKVCIEAFMKVCTECKHKNFTGIQTWDALMSFNDTYLTAQEAFINRRRCVYGYIFPRIDDNVTRKPEHLRKAPYSLHQSTQCVALPLLPHSMETIFTFDPKNCPNSTNKQELVENIGHLTYALNLFNEKLESVLFCERDFPELPILTELAQIPKNEIFVKLRGWTRMYIEKRMLFVLENDYVEHAIDCTVCDHRVFLDRRNTLAKLINRHSWIDDMFITPIEEALKLVFLELCSEFGFFPLDECISKKIASFTTS